MKPPDKLAFQQIQRRLNKLGSMSSEANIRTGWITYMRQAMSMSLESLSKVVGLKTSTVHQIEKREQSGRVTIQSMQKIAAAMNCEFVYALVPKQELSKFLRAKAIEKATLMVNQADVHMTLEDQKVSGDIKARISRIADELLEKGDIW